MADGRHIENRFWL